MVKNQELVLEYQDFKLTGITKGSNPLWFEFSIYNKNFVFENAGGSLINDFINNFLLLITNPKNIPIKDFKQNEYLLKDFKELETFYLGYIVISSYTTFGFFKDTAYIYIRITYNNDLYNIEEPYQFIKIPKNVFEKWCEYLKDFSRKINCEY